MITDVQETCWQVAVVTGASKGIGAETARQLAATVVVNYSTSKEGQTESSPKSPVMKARR
jgi:NAD(P)-dependent dehydrogenase (short-subunit alcohol dehydrogenase family)